MFGVTGRGGGGVRLQLPNASMSYFSIAETMRACLISSGCSVVAFVVQGDPGRAARAVEVGAVVFTDENASDFQSDTWI